MCSNTNRVTMGGNLLFGRQLGDILTPLAYSNKCLNCVNCYSEGVNVMAANPPCFLMSMFQNEISYQIPTLTTKNTTFVTSRTSRKLTIKMSIVLYLVYWKHVSSDGSRAWHCGIPAHF